jgi:hypothetical protein
MGGCGPLIPTDVSHGCDNSDPMLANFAVTQLRFIVNMLAPAKLEQRQAAGPRDAAPAQEQSMPKGSTTLLCRALGTLVAYGSFW